MTTQPLTSEELNSIEARANAATQAPWLVNPDQRKYVLMPFSSEEDVLRDRDANAAFCANARDDIPRLVAEVRRQRAILAMLHIDVRAPRVARASVRSLHKSKQSPIEQEIVWCQAHRGEGERAQVPEFESGFIAGLQQALAVERQAIDVLLEVAESESLDRDELIATLKLWQGEV